METKDKFLDGQGLAEYTEKVKEAIAASGGSTHLYRHSIQFSSNSERPIWATIISASADPYTADSLKQYLNDCGYIDSQSKFLSASGSKSSDVIVVGITLSYDKTSIYTVGQSLSGGYGTTSIYSFNTVDDTIVQIS